MNEALWYFGRGFGVSALLLFSIVVALGAVVRTGRPLPGLPRFTVTAAHRTISLTALGFLLLHVLLLLGDPYAQLRLIDLVVPFVGNFRPLWQGMGTVALDLVVLLTASSLLRSRIGLRTWRALHWTAYLCWPFAVAHAIGNGTDGRSSWLLAIVAVCIVMVVTTVTRRVLTRADTAPPARRVRPPADLSGLR